MSDKKSPSVEETDERRRTPRNFLFFPVPVYDASDPEAEGRLNDVSEHGLQVSGIRSNHGDVKKLIVAPEGLANINSFQLVAECRWAQAGSPGGECVAGYQIVSIDDPDLEELKKLIQSTAFG
jgi:hypothetical protein